jgi:hypothetical protein
MGLDRLELHVALPCGCELHHSCSTAPGEPIDIERSAAALGFYLQDRRARHLCVLVSEDNPSGVPRKAKT